jgi:hypothetical protein
MNILEKLPDIQKKYINRYLFNKSLDYVYRAGANKDLLESYIERDPDSSNIRRYCNLILKYI